MINCLLVEIENEGYTPREIEAMEENEKEVRKLKEWNEVFIKNNELFMENLNKLVFDRIEFDIVVYDEIETFKDYKYNKDNVTYTYPFGVRKNKINSVNLNTLYDIENYEFASQNIKF